MVGLKAGDEKDIKVTFPKDYPSEDLKGKEVTFKVKVNEVKTKSIPELNDDFYQDLGIEGVSSYDTLYDYVKNEITSRKEESNNQLYVDQILDEIAKNIDTEIPHEMIHDEIHFMLKQFEQNIMMQGVNLQQFMQITGKTEEQLHKEYEEPAKNVLCMH